MTEEIPIRPKQEDSTPNDELRSLIAEWRSKSGARAPTYRICAAKLEDVIDDE